MNKLFYNEPFYPMPKKLLKSNISSDAKILYSIIYYASANEGVLTNALLMNELNKSERQITRYLKELKDNGYIDLVMDNKNHRRLITPKFTFDVSLYSSVNDVPDNISDNLRINLEAEESPDNINYVNNYGKFNHIRLKNGDYILLKSRFGVDRLEHYINVLDEKIEFEGLKKPTSFNSYLSKCLENGWFDNVPLKYDKTLFDNDNSNGGFTEI